MQRYSSLQDTASQTNPTPRAGKKLVEALGKGAQFSGSAVAQPLFYRT